MDISVILDTSALITLIKAYAVPPIMGNPVITKDRRWNRSRLNKMSDADLVRLYDQIRKDWDEYTTLYKELQAKGMGYNGIMSHMQAKYGHIRNV